MENLMWKQRLRLNIGTRVPDHILQKCSMFLLVCITVFVMPHMIYAYTKGVPEDQIAEAEIHAGPENHQPGLETRPESLPSGTDPWFYHFLSVHAVCPDVVL